MGMLIHDGYTFDFTIPAQGAFPALNGRYRPAMPDDVNEWRMRATANGKEETAAHAKLLCACLVSWDLTEKVKDLKAAFKDNPNFVERHCQGDADTLVSVPIVPAVLKVLPDVILNRLVAIVTGYGKAAEDDAKN